MSAERGFDPTPILQIVEAAEREFEERWRVASDQIFAPPRPRALTSRERAQRSANMLGRPVRHHGWAAFADPDDALVPPTPPTGSKA